MKKHSIAILAIQCFVLGFQLADILFNKGRYMQPCFVAVLCLVIIKLVFDQDVPKEKKDDEQTKEQVNSQK